MSLRALIEAAHHLEDGVADACEIRNIACLMTTTDDALERERQYSVLQEAVERLAIAMVAMAEALKSSLDPEVD